MATIRELATRFIFKADTDKVAQFDQAVNGAKRSAQQASRIVKRFAEDTAAVPKAAAEGARVVRSAARQTGDAMKSAGAVIRTSNESAAASTRTLAAGVNQMAVEVRRVMERLPRELRAVDEQAKLFGKGFDHAKAKVEALERAIRALTLAGVGADSIHLQGLNAELAAVKAKAAASENRGGGVSGFVGHAGKHLLALGGAYFGFQAVERQVHVFAEFQQGLQKAGAAMLATTEEIARMKDQILRSAGDLGQSPEQLAEVDMELAGQGFKEKQVEAMMPYAAKLARAGLTDPRTSATIIGSTNRSFYGEDVSHVGKVSDVIARVHDLGGIQIPELLESMKYAGPAYNALGQSLEDLGTLTALLGRAGIKGSMAGTGTRTMLLRLAAPMVAGRKKLESIGLGAELEKGESSSVVKELGLKVENAKGDMLPMTQILKQLVEKTKGMGNVRKAGIYNKLFGLEHVGDALLLAKQLEGHNFDHVAHEIEHSNGTLDRMYKIMSKGLIPAWNRFVARLDVAGALLMEKVSPGLESTLDGLGWLLDKGRDFIKWLDEATDGGKRLHGALVVLKGALIVLLPFLAAAGLSALPGLLWAIADIIAGPVCLAIGAATRAVIAFLATFALPAAVIAAFALVALALEDIYVWATGGKSAFGDLWDEIAEEGGTVLYGIWKFFTEDIPKAVDGFIKSVGPAMSGMWEAVKQLAQMAWDALVNACYTASDNIVNSVATAFENVYNKIVEWVDKALGKVRELGDAVRRAMPGGGSDSGELPGTYGVGPLRTPDLSRWSGGLAMTPALAGVSPGADVVSRSGGSSSNTSVNAPVTANTTINLNVGRGADLPQTSQVVGEHLEHAVRKAVADAAKLLPKQSR